MPRYTSAESTLMTSNGKRLQRLMATSVLPDAVGPIRQIAIFTGLPLLAAQEQLVEFSQRNGRPRRAAMIALIRAFRRLHFTQQRIHFLNG